MATIAYYPAGEGKPIKLIELGEDFTRIEPREDPVLDDNHPSRGTLNRFLGVSRHRVRFTFEGGGIVGGAFEELWRQLKALEVHLRNGGYCHVFGNDSSREAWTLATTPANGDTAWVPTTAVLAGAVDVGAAIAVGDLVRVHSFEDAYLNEDKKVLTVGPWSSDPILFDHVGDTIVSDIDTWLFMRWPADQARKGFLRSDERRIWFTLDVELQQDVQSLANVVDAL